MPPHTQNDSTNSAKQHGSESRATTNGSAACHRCPQIFYLPIPLRQSVRWGQDTWHNLGTIILHRESHQYYLFLSTLADKFSINCILSEALAAPRMTSTGRAGPVQHLGNHVGLAPAQLIIYTTKYIQGRCCGIVVGPNSSATVRRGKVKERTTTGKRGSNFPPNTPILLPNNGGATSVHLGGHE